MRKSVLFLGLLFIFTGCNEVGQIALDQQATREAAKAVEAQHAEALLAGGREDAPLFQGDYSQAPTDLERLGER